MSRPDKKLKVQYMGVSVSVSSDSGNAAVFYPSIFLEILTFASLVTLPLLSTLMNSIKVSVLRQLWIKPVTTTL